MPALRWDVLVLRNYYPIVRRFHKHWWQLWMAPEYPPYGEHLLYAVQKRICLSFSTKSTTSAIPTRPRKHHHASKVVHLGTKFFVSQAFSALSCTLHSWIRPTRRMWPTRYTLKSPQHSEDRFFFSVLTNFGMAERLVPPWKSSNNTISAVHRLGHRYTLLGSGRQAAGAYHLNI